MKEKHLCLGGRSHPAGYGPGRRPSHTLSPALVTRPDGSLAHVIGTMGGDVQPQILLQLLARLLVSGEDPATAIAAARVVPEAPGAPPFRLWKARSDPATLSVPRPGMSSCTSRSGFAARRFA